MWADQKSVLTMMGQADHQVSTVQKSIELKAQQPSLFVEDMTPEERAKYYKTVLKVS